MSRAAFNIAARPFIVTLRRGGVTVELVRWADSAAEAREAAESELNGDIEIVSVKERR